MSRGEEQAAPAEAQIEQQPSLKRGDATGEAETQGAEKQARVEPTATKKRSLKGVATLVVAMRRFANSLNPTYTYGKQTTSTSSGGATVRPASGAGAVSSRPISPGHPHDEKYAYADHGHRFEFLLKPLPPTEEEEREWKRTESEARE